MMEESHFSAVQFSEGGVNEEKRRQWEECHWLFMAWTTKLHSLLHS